LLFKLRQRFELLQSRKVIATTRCILQPTRDAATRRFVTQSSVLTMLSIMPSVATQISHKMVVAVDSREEVVAFMELGMLPPPMGFYESQVEE
jgi:hypothetical protein